VVRTLHVDVGDQVTAGAPLATIDSAAVGGERSRLVAATSRLRIAEQNHARAQNLHAQGVVAETELLAALQELEAARGERAAAAAATGLVGGGQRQRLRAAQPARRHGDARGAHHRPRRRRRRDLLFEIVDVSSMRADLEIPEGDLAVVRDRQRGDAGGRRARARAFTGRIDYIAPEIARDTRTAKARVLLPNPDGALRANMFARARSRWATRARA
jgi:cobalt-zinc-cadmium efflux system membrane fusion protein